MISLRDFLLLLSLSEVIMARTIQNPFNVQVPPNILSSGGNCVIHGGKNTNGSTPFVGNLAGPLSEGKSVVIIGNAPPQHSEQGFSINLACSTQPDPTVDIAFHFNPRFNQSCVVRNTKKNGTWGQEECQGSFPFQKGVQFKIVIHANHNQYSVLVNGQHFCNFKHRIPMQNVKTVTVNNGIQITSVRFDGFSGGSMPDNFPGGNHCVDKSRKTKFTSHPATPQTLKYPGGNQPLYNPHVPLTTAIPGGVFPGKIISVSGIPYPKCSRFTVNLQCGQQKGTADIALHFDVHFNDSGNGHQIVRNVKTSGQWGQAERHMTYFPFVPNLSFDILILCVSNAFKIAVNNQHFTEFAHKLMPLNRINTLHVGGDVTLTQVRFQ